MKREFKFYTEFAERQRKYEEELSILDDASDDDNDDFMEKFHTMQERTQLIPNPEKIEKFQKLAKKSKVLAEMLSLDLVIEEDERFGRIQMSSPDFMVPAPLDPKARKTLAWLIAEANDISIHSEENDAWVHMRLIYELYDEHYVWIDKF